MKMTTMAQDENLERVTERIDAVVLEFCALHRQFHMVDLGDFVRSRVEVAPDSPGRILRELRRAGKVRYRVIDRRNSEYIIEAAAPTTPGPAAGDNRKTCDATATLFGDISPDRSYRE